MDIWFVQSPATYVFEGECSKQFLAAPSQMALCNKCYFIGTGEPKLNYNYPE